MRERRRRAVFQPPKTPRSLSLSTLGACRGRERTKKRDETVEPVSLAMSTRGSRDTHFVRTESAVQNFFKERLQLLKSITSTIHD